MDGGWKATLGDVCLLVVLMRRFRSLSAALEIVRSPDYDVEILVVFNVRVYIEIYHVSRGFVPTVTANVKYYIPFLSSLLHRMNFLILGFQLVSIFSLAVFAAFGATYLIVLPTDSPFLDPPN